MFFNQVLVAHLNVIDVFDCLEMMVVLSSFLYAWGRSNISVPSLYAYSSNFLGMIRRLGIVSRSLPSSSLSLVLYRFSTTLCPASARVLFRRAPVLESFVVMIFHGSSPSATEANGVFSYHSSRRVCVRWPHNFSSSPWSSAMRGSDDNIWDGRPKVVLRYSEVKEGVVNAEDMSMSNLG